MKTIGPDLESKSTLAMVSVALDGSFVGVWKFQTCPGSNREVVATAITGEREHETVQTIKAPQQIICVKFISTPSSGQTFPVSQFATHTFWLLDSTLFPCWWRVKDVYFDPAQSDPRRSDGVGMRDAVKLAR